MFTACECFSTADDGKKGMGPGCSVLQKDAISGSSVGGTGAEGGIELINRGENSHPNHVEKCQRMRRSFMSGICSRCLPEGKMRRVARGSGKIRTEANV